MTESPRRSNRLQLKDKVKKSQNNALIVKFSPKKKLQDEDMFVLQCKQARVPLASDNYELRHIIGSRTNNFTRVHNSYCTFDRIKYDGYVYDPSFINDSSSTSSSSQEDSGSEGSSSKTRRVVIHSSSDTEVEKDDLQLNETEACGANGIEQIFLKTPLKETGYGDRNVLKREKPRVSSGSSSDEELISSARKPKISVLSSDSGSEENIFSPRQRAPSARAIKVQARMNEDRENRFANFRAKRIQSKQTVNERGTSDTSVINLGEVRRKLREETHLLPTEHQGLSGLCASRNLFGDSPESSSAGEGSNEFNASYIQGLSYTRQLIGEEEFTLDFTNNSDGIFNDKSPPLPVVYEFSDATAVKEDSQFSIKQQMLCSHSTIPNSNSNSFPILEDSNSSNVTEYETYTSPINLQEFSPVEPGCTAICTNVKDIPTDKLGCMKDACSSNI